MESDQVIQADLDKLHLSLRKIRPISQRFIFTAALEARIFIYRRGAEHS